MASLDFSTLASLFCFNFRTRVVLFSIFFFPSFIFSLLSHQLSFLFFLQPVDLLPSFLISHNSKLAAMEQGLGLGCSGN
jgi:hypothetical protein